MPTAECRPLLPKAPCATIKTYLNRIGMLLAPVIWLVAAATAILVAGKFWWFPAPISALAVEYDRQFSLTLIVIGGIFLVAQAGLGYVIFRFRDSGRPARFSRGDNRLEVIWTAATAVLFIGLALAGETIWAGIHMQPEPAGALQVEVLAKQFSWSFRYPGPDGKFGRTDIKLINDSAGNPFGLDDKDPAARDDIMTSALRVPAGRPVVLTMQARDVIHDFFVPELRVKQDLVPGMRIPFQFQADKTGEYEIACAELCGLGHHQMRSTLRVLTPEAFRDWLADQRGLQ